MSNSYAGLDEAIETVRTQSQIWNGNVSATSLLSSTLKSVIGVLTELGVNTEELDEMRSLRNSIELASAIGIESGDRNLTPDEANEVRNSLDRFESVLTHIRASLSE